MPLSNNRRVWVWAGVLASHLMFAAAADGQSVSFIARQDFAADSQPASVAVGDFNADGIPDLAVANSYSNDVSVLLGNGDGTFQTARNFGAGSFPTYVAVGDFNGDGVPDLVVTNAGTPPDYAGSVSVFLGKGDGSFQAAQSFGAGSYSTSVAVGDLNGDGVPDLVVANAGMYPDYAGSVSVLLGSGDGSFQTAQSLSASDRPRSVAVGDFNGDGKLDLAVAGGFVSVLLGNGDGTFQAAVHFGPGGSSVAVGDFNGDEKLDLAVAYPGTVPHYFGSVSVLLGNGDGSFQEPQRVAGGISPLSVAVGDFNGDGALDVAVANDFSSPGTGGFVSVLLGNGDGSFRAAPSFVAGGILASVAVGDFNGDGALDLAVADSAGVSVLMGNGDGRFQATPSFDAGFQPQSVVVGDFNGDGALDLAVANLGQRGVAVLLGNGDGSFQVMQSFAAGSLAEVVAVGDFNSDGALDLAVADSMFPNSTVSVLLGNGDGTFHDPQGFGVGLYPSSVAVGDFNGDGAPDLAVANSGSSNNISVLLGNGDGSFQPARSVVAGNGPWSVAVGDFNGDGNVDLAVANAVSNDVSVLLGNGDGSFQPAQNFYTGNAPRSVAVGDFNADGKLDLAMAGGSVSVLLGNGDGTFQVAVPFGPIGVSVAVGDFNGDEKLDLAVATPGANNVSVFLGNGDGSFQAAHSFGAGSSPWSVATGDFNGDGALDLAVANRNSSSVSVLINKTPR